MTNDLTASITRWQQFTKGIELLAPHSNIKPSEGCTLEILKEALSTLKMAKNDFEKKYYCNQLDKHTFESTYKLAGVIKRIALAVENSNLCRPVSAEKIEWQRILTKIRNFDHFFIQKIEELHFSHLMAETVLRKLHGMDPDTPLIEALLGEQGLTSMPVLRKALDIETLEVLDRVLKNANLFSVRQFIALLNRNYDKNILEILKKYLETKRFIVLAKMDARLKDKFWAQWNKIYQKDWIHEGRMQPYTESYEKEKLDAHDFFRGIQLEREIYALENGCLYKNTRIFHSNDNKFFMSLFNFNVEKSAQSIFGNANFLQLKPYDNYLWSENGKTFYRMNLIYYVGSGKNYQTRFSVAQGAAKCKKFLEIIVCPTYAVMSGARKNSSQKYERLELEKVERLLSDPSFKILSEAINFEMIEDNYVCSF